MLSQAVIFKSTQYFCRNVLVSSMKGFYTHKAICIRIYAFNLFGKKNRTHNLKSRNLPIFWGNFSKVPPFLLLNNKWQVMFCNLINSSHYYVFTFLFPLVINFILILYKYYSVQFLSFDKLTFNSIPVSYCLI